jgi:hypothetical protein
VSTLSKDTTLKTGISQAPFLITQQTPLVWSFKTKDLEGSFGQVFEE